jgi:hypothetical protein
VALEIGTHSPWISRLLSELGHEVIVANARKVRLIAESRKKDDRLDAQTLARLARIDPQLLYPVKHRSAQAQADLMMIRARASLVRARIGLVKNSGPEKEPRTPYEPRIPLTPTGLLMEGHCTQIPTFFDSVHIRTFLLMRLGEHRIFPSRHFME